MKPNITPWRRAVAGDLTSAFDFRSPNKALSTLPSTAAFAPPDALRHPDYKPLPPSTQSLPAQEPGLRRARALPYRSAVEGGKRAGQFAISFGIGGSVGTIYQMRSGNPLELPRTYTVAPGLTLADRWTAAADGSFDLSVYRPNGFLRAWHGNLSSSAHAALAVTAEEDAALCGLTLVVANTGSFPVHAVVTDACTRQTVRQAVQPGQQHRIALALSELFGWYDLSVSVEEDVSFGCQLAGHVETGRDSVTDPAIGLPI